MRTPDPRVRSAGFLLLYLLAVTAIAAFFHLRTPNLVDPDAFYHFRHASLYASRGPLFSGFPWTTCSVLGHVPGDLWYGFHMLLAPFTWVPDPVLGIKIAGIFLLAASMLLFYAALLRLGVAVPYVWPFLLLFSSQPGLMRLLATRPHVLSTGLLALLLAILIRGAVWEAAAVGFAVAFFHLNLAWIVLLMVVVVSVVQLRTTGSCDRRIALTAIAGALAGWLLRPDAIGAARLAYVQLVRLAAAKQGGVPLLYGAELSPIDTPGLLAHFTPFLVVWLGAVGLVVAAGLPPRVDLEPHRWTLLWSALILSLVFFELTVVGSLRASDQWRAFAVILAAAAGTAFLFRKWGGRDFLRERTVRLFQAVGAVAIGVMLWRGTNAEALRWAYGTIQPDRYRAAAEWLKAHSPQDAVVFNVLWGSFPDLFFRNQKNRYINGMDPIFMYAYDEALYWKAHHLATGEAAEFTCGKIDCGEADRQDTFEVLTRDFQASYVFLDKQRSPALFDYGNRDARFRLRFEDERSAVFELVGP